MSIIDEYGLGNSAGLDYSINTMQQRLKATGYITKNSYAPQAKALPSAYLIKSPESIYIYNRKNNELILTKSSGSIVNTIPLIINGDVKKL